MELKVFGNSWGLACNFIHFLDLIDYFNDELNYRLIKNNLSKIYKSKRKGFYDFYGALRFITKKNTKIYFSSKMGRLSLKCVLIFKDNSYEIDMIKNHVIEKSLKSKKLSVRKNIIPFVSEQSGLFAKKIYKNNFNDLPTLKNSCKLHIPLIKIFCESFYRIKKIRKRNYCPIT